MTVAALKAQNRAFTVEFESDTADKLLEAARVRETTPEELIARAVEFFLLEDDHAYELSANDIAAIEEGREQIARGEVVAQEELMARLKAKYGG